MSDEPNIREMLMPRSRRRRSKMRHIKAIYDGSRVVLLEPVNLPPHTPLEIVVIDAEATDQHVLEALKAQGLIRGTEAPINRLAPTTPIRVEGPSLSQTVLEDRE